MNNNRREFMAIVLMLLMMTGMFALTGCGSKDAAQDLSPEDTYQDESAEDETYSNDETYTDDSIGNTDDQSSGDWKSIDEQPEIDLTSLGGPGGVDVDISKLSSTMTYAVVNDMLTRPNTYMDKKIRINGDMSVYHDEDTGNTYYACIIRDATACCAQGIEFLTTDEFSVEDYPADGEDVTVVGTYDLYEENGYEYCVLKDAILE